MTKPTLDLRNAISCHLELGTIPYMGVRSGLAGKASLGQYTLNPNIEPHGDDDGIRRSAQRSCLDPSGQLKRIMNEGCQKEHHTD